MTRETIPEDVGDLLEMLRATWCLSEADEVFVTMSTSGASVELLTDEDGDARAFVFDAEILGVALAEALLWAIGH